MVICTVRIQFYLYLISTHMSGGVNTKYQELSGCKQLRSVASERAEVYVKTVCSATAHGRSKTRVIFPRNNNRRIIYNYDSRGILADGGTADEHLSPKTVVCKRVGGGGGRTVLTVRGEEKTPRLSRLALRVRAAPCYYNTVRYQLREHLRNRRKTSCWFPTRSLTRRRTAPSSSPNTHPLARSSRAHVCKCLEVTYVRAGAETRAVRAWFSAPYYSCAEEHAQDLLRGKESGKKKRKKPIRIQYDVDTRLHTFQSACDRACELHIIDFTAITRALNNTILFRTSVFTGAQQRK